MTSPIWDAILRHYDENHRPRVERERACFAKSASIEEAISRAALATDERGKRFRHQRRIPRQALETARNEFLQHQEEIKNATDFDELLAIITNTVRDVHRTGELYAYDTALRISYYLDLLPRRIYLHAGTRAGARVLHLSHNNRSIDASDLPPALQRRPAHEVEDILCIYKAHFTSE